MSEDDALSPAEMLDLAARQQRRVGAQRGAEVPLLLMGWGIAWAAGFLSLFAEASSRERSGPPSIGVVIAVAALFVGAVALSGFVGARAGRGTRGTRAAAVTGIVYGNLWWVGIAAIALVGLGLRSAGLPAGLLWVLYPVLFTVYCGVMFVAGGLLWPAPPMIALGGWMLLVGVSGAFVAAPGHLLFLGVAGGGGLVAVAGWAWIWVRRSR